MSSRRILTYVLQHHLFNHPAKQHRTNHSRSRRNKVEHAPGPYVRPPFFQDITITTAGQNQNFPGPLRPDSDFFNAVRDTKNPAVHAGSAGTSLVYDVVRVSLDVGQCLFQCIRWLMGYYRNFDRPYNLSKVDRFLFNFDVLDVFVR